MKNLLLGRQYLKNAFLKTLLFFLLFHEKKALVHLYYNVPFWIGLNDIHEERIFQWMDGTQVSVLIYRQVCAILYFSVRFLANSNFLNIKKKKKKKEKQTFLHVFIKKFMFN